MLNIWLLPFKGDHYIIIHARFLIARHVHA